MLTPSFLVIFGLALLGTCVARRATIPHRRAASSSGITFVPVPPRIRLAARNIVRSKKLPTTADVISVRTLPGITSDGKDVPQRTVQVRYTGTKEAIAAGKGKRELVYPRAISPELASATTPNASEITPLQAEVTLRTCDAGSPPFRTLPSFEDGRSLANGVVSLLFYEDLSVVEFCSGWLVHPLRVVTAAHCIYELSTKSYFFNDGKSLVASTGLNGDDDSLYSSTTVDSVLLPSKYLTYKTYSQSLKDGTDTAVLLLSTPLTGRTYKWSSPSKGLARMVLGYPAVSQTGFDQIGDIIGDPAAAPKYGFLDGVVGGNIICEDLSTEGGHSGSPLFAAYNSDVVVGTLSGGMATSCPKFFTLAVPRISVTSVTALLRSPKSRCSVSTSKGLSRVLKC